MRDGALERSGAETKDPRAELGQHLRGLFDSCGFSLRQFTQKHGFSHSAIARYLSGERLPRKAFLDALLNERDNDDVTPATEDVRQLTFSLYRAALGPVAAASCWSCTSWKSAWRI
ncbi:helix-turn-helix domain-containing protein [Streptomyces sp. NPDC054802]